MSNGNLRQKLLELLEGLEEMSKRERAIIDEYDEANGTIDAEQVAKHSSGGGAHSRIDAAMAYIKATARRDLIREIASEWSRINKAFRTD